MRWKGLEGRTSLAAVMDGLVGNCSFGLTYELWRRKIDSDKILVVTDIAMKKLIHHPKEKEREARAY